ncbi:outer membrane beta-barrel protein [Nonlabens sp.]|uniref:outer membrane beta-barrel protein n=1 Tax=Nonlabens sp. TaxID=1888209 RepID=UPI001BCB5A8B|nr:outer membrane beta-barrel protein [Nonlabens sp.]
MRYLLLIISLSLLSYHSIAQEVVDSLDTKWKESEIKQQFHLKAGFQTDFSLGESYISSADSPALGFNIQADWQFYKSFQLGLGMFNTYHKNLDSSVSGLVEQINLTGTSIGIGYLIPLSEIWSVSPHIKYAAIKLNQKTAYQNKELEENADMIIVGASINYQLNNNISSFIDVEFRQLYYDIDPSPQLQELYDNDHFLTLSIGLRYSFFSKKSLF